MTEPKIIEAEPKTLIGSRIETSLSENRTKELWQAFGPKIKLIKNRVNVSESWSVEIYEKAFDPRQFTPATTFEKWAAVEVSDFEDVPAGLEKLAIPRGKYAVFTFKGLHSEAVQFLGHIFGTWLPNSGYKLDDRPHFGIMGEKYHGPFDPESVEDFYIPIT